MLGSNAPRKSPLLLEGQVPVTAMPGPPGETSPIGIGITRGLIRSLDVDLNSGRRE